MQYANKIINLPYAFNSDINMANCKISFENNY